MGANLGRCVLLKISNCLLHITVISSVQFCLSAGCLKLAQLPWNVSIKKDWLDFLPGFDLHLLELQDPSWILIKEEIKDFGDGGLGNFQPLISQYWQNEPSCVWMFPHIKKDCFLCYFCLLISGCVCVCFSWTFWEKAGGAEQGARGSEAGSALYTAQRGSVPGAARAGGAQRPPEGWVWSVQVSETAVGRMIRWCLI